MTAISLGLAARPSRLGMRAITAATKVGQLPRDSDRYLVCSVQLGEQFERGNVASRPQECAGGFVDFLLGRRPPSSVILSRPEDWRLECSKEPTARRQRPPRLNPPS